MTSVIQSPTRLRISGCVEAQRQLHIPIFAVVGAAPLHSALCPVPNAQRKSAAGGAVRVSAIASISGDSSIERSGIPDKHQSAAIHTHHSQLPLVAGDAVRSPDAHHQVARAASFPNVASAEGAVEVQRKRGRGAANGHFNPCVPA